jgi:hypothetical protein
LITTKRCQPAKRFFLFGAGLPYERLVASSSDCLVLFAGAVSERYSGKRYNYDERVKGSN